jgi:hypothetical protein
MLAMYDEKQDNKALRIVETLLESHPKNVELHSFKAMTLG